MERVDSPVHPNASTTLGRNRSCDMAIRRQIVKVKRSLLPNKLQRYVTRVIICAGTVVLVNLVHGRSLARSAEGPAIRFEETSYDFGILPPDRRINLAHDFFFHNDGDETLQILSVGQACNTVATCLGKEVRPGQSSSIRVTMVYTRDPVGFADSSRVITLNRHIQIRTNDPRQPSIELAVSVLFAFSLDWKPKIVDFGTFRAGKRPRHSVTIESRTRAPFKLRGVKFQDPKMFEARRVRAASDSHLLPNAAHRRGRKGCAMAALEIQCTSSLPEGPFLQIARVATDRPDIRVIEIPIRGEVLKGPHVEPPSVFFGIIHTQEAVNREVQIVMGDSRLQIRELRSTLEGLSHALHAEKDGYRLRMEFDPNGHEGAVSGEVLVILTTPLASMIRIPVRGFVKPLSPEPVSQ